MMTSEHEEVRHLLSVLSAKVAQCIELLEAQNVGNALYGLRGMNSDYKEVRSIIIALTPKIATAREDLNGQALGNSLYGLQSMSSKESEVRLLLAVLATKVSHTWEDLKAQEIGNALYGLKRMSSDVPEVRILLSSLVTKIAKSPDVLDAQAIGNSLYGMQNMRSNNPEVLSLLTVLAEKLTLSFSELDGQAMGNSMFGLQGMSSDYPEVRAVINALSIKISNSCLDLNAQELGNSIYGLQSMSCEHSEVRNLVTVLIQKLQSCKQELSSQEIGNTVFGLQGMCSGYSEIRVLIRHIAVKTQQSHAILDPHCIAMCLFGLQRMSSECEDVRLLVLALSTKIEHSWKLMSAQNLSSGIYGLHSMSSNEIEVRYLVKTLVAKVMSCRDEMSAKQIGYLFLGLQHMSSEHSEVLLLISALTEKISKSNDQWSMSTLSMVLFGSQGFCSSHDEVGLLLHAIAVKAVDLLPEKAVDGHLLANCFFGLQRMDTDNANVCTVLNVLSHRLDALSATFKAVDLRICASIIYGVQNCSCTFEVVKAILSHVAEFVQHIANSLLDLPHRRNSKSSALDSPYPDLTIDRSERKLDDLLGLFQALTLSLFALRDLDFDKELQGRLDTGLASMRQVIELQESELVSRQLTHPERRMTKEVADMLSKEPFIVRTGVFVKGFFMTVLIQPSKSPIKPPFNANAALTTELNIEVRGSSFSFPCKDLFYRLRRNYLEATGVIKVEYVPMESFRQENQHGMKIHSAVLLPLYTEGAETLPLAYNKSLGCSSLSSDSFLNSSTTRSNSWDVVASGAAATNAVGPFEYSDDDYAMNCIATTGLKKKIRTQTSSYAPKLPLGVTLSWQGTWPLVDKSLFVVTNATTNHAVSVSSYIHGHSLSLNMDRISGPSMPSSITSIASDSIGRSSPLNSTNLTTASSRMSIISSGAPNRAQMMEKDLRLQLNSYSHNHSNRMDDTIGGGKSNPEGVLLTSRSLDALIARQPRTPSVRSVEAFDSNSIISRTSSNNDFNSVSTSMKLGSAPSSAAPFPLSPSSGGKRILIASSSVSSDIDFGLELRAGSQHFNLSPCSLSSAEDDEIDYELAALEAQLEVARLEAKIKALKAKKKQAK